MLTEEGKRALLRETAVRYGLRTFVETGTYHGDTLASMLAEPRIIDWAYSVELHPRLARLAQQRFEGVDPRVVIVAEGDSAQWVEHFVDSSFDWIDQPALFWLDAHPGEPGTAGEYGQCPLRGELKAIFRDPKFDHVVLVDDARLLCEEGWPSLEEIREIAAGWAVSLEDDIVRICREEPYSLKDNRQLAEAGSLSRRPR